jgi:hypothetical protein
MAADQGGPATSETGGWRHAIRSWLSERTEQPISMATLMEEFATVVPVEAAAREWNRHHPPQTFSTENQRLFYLLRHEVGRYQPDPLDGTQARNWTAQTTFVVHPKACAQCGQPFISDRQTVCCSNACSRAHLKKAAIVVQQRQPALRVEKDDDPLEIQVLRIVVSALRRLPDQAARRRVMVYVQDLPFLTVAQPNGQDHPPAPEEQTWPSGKH